MARGVNKAILVGNLGADPETRYTSGGTCVTNIRLATTEQWRDRQSGEQQERTEWHRVVLWGKLGEVAEQYLRKGSKVYVEGSLRTRKWQDQSGQDRYTTEIVGNEMQMLDSRGGSGQGAGGFQGGGDFNQAPPQQAPAAAPAGGTPAGGASAGGASAGGAPAQGGGSFDSFDDDIPF